MSNEIKLWYAVNGSGQGCVFTSYPVRDEHWKTWCGDMASCYTMTVMMAEAEYGLKLPALKWSDEPVPITLKIETDG